MYFKLIMLVVAIYASGLMFLSLYIVSTDNRKAWDLKVAQSFGIICFGVVSDLYILWMPHCNWVSAMLGIIFIIAPVLAAWSIWIFNPKLRDL